MSAFDDRPQELPRTCAGCGKPMIAVQLQADSSTPVVCGYCGWDLQQDETRKTHAGGPPPPEAYERSLYWDRHPLGPTKREV